MRGPRHLAGQDIARLDHRAALGDTDHAFGRAHLPEATRWQSAGCAPVAAA